MLWVYNDSIETARDQGPRKDKKERMKTSYLWNNEVNNIERIIKVENHPAKTKINSWAHLESSLCAKTIHTAY